MSYVITNSIGIYISTFSIISWHCKGAACWNLLSRKARNCFSFTAKYVCRCPGLTRSQGINRHGIEQVSLAFRIIRNNHTNNFWKQTIFFNKSHLGVNHPFLSDAFISPDMDTGPSMLCGTGRASGVCGVMHSKGMLSSASIVMKLVQ